MGIKGAEKRQARAARKLAHKARAKAKGRKRAGSYKGPRAQSMDLRLRAIGTEALARAESDPVRILGLRWYPLALEWARDLESRYREHGATLRGIVGAIAALSPQVAWTDQARFLPGFLESVLVDRDASTLPHPGFLRNRARARDILLGADPETTLSGPKVTAFYAAILGDRAAVVVDRHAATLALGYRCESLTARTVSEIQGAYTRAARALNVDPRALQSLLWSHYKATGAAAEHEAPLFFESASAPSLSLEALGLGWGDDPLRAFYPPDSALPAPDRKAPLVPGAEAPETAAQRRALRAELESLPF